MLFRIEDISGDAIKNNTDCAYEVELNKKEVDAYIANEIRRGINGANNSVVTSYSKSLATCILKYNKFNDNELHIGWDYWLNSIYYISTKGNEKRKLYSITNRMSQTPIALFKKGGKIKLKNFAIDVSNNNLVDNYLKRYTGVGKKKIASPEKDCEVIAMKPLNCLIINQYMDAVYILYALQFKYNFLCDTHIRESLICELNNMCPFYFENYPDEKDAFITLIEYFDNNWESENKISNKIYEYFKNTDHLSSFYDSILQFHDIVFNDFDFEHLYNLSEYNDNRISELFWKYCEKHINSESF